MCCLGTTFAHSRLIPETTTSFLVTTRQSHSKGTSFNGRMRTTKLPSAFLCKLASTCGGVFLNASSSRSFLLADMNEKTSPRPARRASTAAHKDEIGNRAASAAANASTADRPKEIL